MIELFQDWLHIMSDPAHLIFEVTVILVVDVLFGLILWPWLKRTIHRDIDRAHGIRHGRKGKHRRTARNQGDY